MDATALSVQAKEKVLEYIRTSDLGPDRKLPREEELASIVGVSRITLRTALNELAVEGIITRRHGRGTFVNVAATNLTATLNPMVEFSDLIRAGGHEPGLRLLGISMASDAVAEAGQLGLPADTPVVIARKIFLADQRFCALCVDYIPLELLGGPDDLDDFDHYADSVFRYVAAKSGRRVVRDQITVSAVSGEKARTFAGDVPEIPASPLLLVEGVNYDEEDRPVLLAREFIDTSIIELGLLRRRVVDYR